MNVVLSYKWSYLLYTRLHSQIMCIVCQILSLPSFESILTVTHSLDITSKEQKMHLATNLDASILDKRVC